MLTLIIPPREPKEYFDSVNRIFIYGDPFPGKTIIMEHSLYTISKWEEKWKIPYLTKKEKTPEQWIDYLRFMSVNSPITDLDIENLTDINIKEINDYINDPMSAKHINSTLKEEGKSRYNPDMTSDDIYASMVIAKIPFECEHWHLNRLLNLIELVARKQAPPKKMSKNDLMRRNSKLNAARRSKYNTKG